MTNEELVQHQRREAEFRATPIGASFTRFKNKLARAWQADGNESMSDRRLTEIWDEARLEETEFRRLLGELMLQPVAPAASPKPCENFIYEDVIASRQGSGPHRFVPEPVAPAGDRELVALDAFDAGELNTYGGGNVGWWLDYIRALLGDAHQFYQEQVDAALSRARTGSEAPNWTRCPSTHCERAQECRSPNECSGTGKVK